MAPGRSTGLFRIGKDEGDHARPFSPATTPCSSAGWEDVKSGGGSKCRHAQHREDIINTHQVDQFYFMPETG